MSSDRIASLASEIHEYELAKQEVMRILSKLKEDLQAKIISQQQYTEEMQQVTQGKSEAAFLAGYDEYLSFLHGQMLEQTSSARDSLQIEKSSEKKSSAPKPVPTNRELAADIDREAFRRFVKSKKTKKKNVPVILAKYVLYEPSSLGKFANSFFSDRSLRISKKYPVLFGKLFDDLRSSDFEILSKTYVSMMLLFTIIAIPVGFLVGLLFFDNIFLKILNALVFAVLFGGVTFFGMYFYPSYLKGRKRSAMKADLPFVVIHMAAVAGSGAQPVSMSNLVLSSSEYKGLEPEIKKIINYVNLFGYDLTTSLRLVASSTPLQSFNELLYGIVTTIETGGDLKKYLEIKAGETMEAYELERKRFTENIATFSDIYIGISIAAPMMLFVVLGIINTPVLGGSIAGLSAGTLATAGTFVVIPFINLAFILLVDAMQPR